MSFIWNEFRDEIGKVLGFVFSYFLFTTILFYVLRFFGKIYELNYLKFMGITALITLVGVMVARFLR